MITIIRIILNSCENKDRIDNNKYNVKFKVMIKGTIIIIIIMIIMTVIIKSKDKITVAEKHNLEYQEKCLHFLYNNFFVHFDSSRYSLLWTRKTFKTQPYEWRYMWCNRFPPSTDTFFTFINKCLKEKDIQ